ncbi:hypothetical protein [Nocardia cyriacigeorgica]|uniref:hypothetical protein n=1 Tax=Nocardia cyriacigeorgica TaxID=135487 RepID=UPI002454BF90|nr:hypothetical protein [Nocardia cyriacigeorgica]
MPTFASDGPHTKEQLHAAAVQIVELWHYIHQATAASPELLDDPAEVSAMVWDLARAGHIAGEVLGRLSFWSLSVGDQSTYTDRFTHDDPDGTRDQIQSEMYHAARELRSAATETAAPVAHLLSASRWMSWTRRTQADT